MEQVHHGVALVNVPVRVPLPIMMLIEQRGFFWMFRVVYNEASTE